MAKPTKQQKQQYLDGLIFYANELGFGVDLETMSPTNENGEKNPAGMCVTSGPIGGIPDQRLILIRQGKGLNGQITSLAHELVHAHQRLSGEIHVGAAADALAEWTCESVAHYLTQLLGIDRRERTEAHVLQYVGKVAFRSDDYVRDLVLGMYKAATNGHQNT